MEICKDVLKYVGRPDLEWLLPSSDMTWLNSTWSITTQLLGTILNVGKWILVPNIILQ